MSWSGDKISTRKAKKGRDVSFDDFHIICMCLVQDWFRDVVKALETLTPNHLMGRPREHSLAVIVLLALCSDAMGSQIRGELYMRSPGRWFEFLKILRRQFPDDPLLCKGIKPPSRSVLRHVREKMDQQFNEQIHQAMEDSAMFYATIMGLGVNTGTYLEPSQNAILFGDAVVVKPISSYTSDDKVLNTTTGELQQRRHDPDADTFTTGDNRVVRGNCFAHLSAYTGNPGEQITFAFKPVTKSGINQEANVALAMTARVKHHFLGFAALAWDKALRGRRIHEVWNLGIQPLIGVYDKTGKSTEIVPLDITEVNGISVQTFAHNGAVCIKGSGRELIPLDPIKLDRKTNKSGTFRHYGLYRIPEGTDCDTRLWGYTLTQRLDAEREGGLRYGEYVRAIPPQSDRWKVLYGIRSLAESFNSWFKARLLPSQRARGYGRNRQWFDLMITTMIRNTVSLMRYLLRTKGSTEAIL